MNEFLAVVLTGLLSFMSMDYTLGRATVKDPVRVVIAAIFAVILVVVAGVFGLAEVIDL